MILDAVKSHMEYFQKAIARAISLYLDKRRKEMGDFLFFTESFEVFYGNSDGDICDEIPEMVFFQWQLAID